MSSEKISNSLSNIFKLKKQYITVVIIVIIAMIVLLLIFSSIYAFVSGKKDLRSAAKDTRFGQGKTHHLLLRSGERANVVCQGENITSEKTGNNNILQIQCEAGRQPTPPRPSFFLQPSVSQPSRRSTPIVSRWPTPVASSQPTNTASEIPIIITVQNYTRFRDALLVYRPFDIYAWATNPAISDYEEEISTLASVTDNDIEKSIVFSSHQTLQEKLAQSGHSPKNSNLRGWSWLCDSLFYILKKQPLVFSL